MNLVIFHLIKTLLAEIRVVDEYFFNCALSHTVANWVTSAPVPQVVGIEVNLIFFLTLDIFCNFLDQIMKDSPLYSEMLIKFLLCQYTPAQ